MELKKLGVWAPVEGFRAEQAADFAKRIEAWGYGALWLNEALGREALTSSGWLLANTTKLIIGTGIATIYGRDPQAASAAQKTLAELSNGRFLLGLGVSHAPLVTMRHQDYGKPIETMTAYLKGMREAAFTSVLPAESPKTVIAALRPRMLELARDLADGAIPYNVTPEHTEKARKILGPGKLLCVEQAAILETDPAKARGVARRFLPTYLRLPNYLELWKSLGFAGADFENGGSDRLVDGVFVWGDEKAIRTRIDAHWAAGADHVCVQALSPASEGYPSTDEKLLALLAPGS
jgi:probable F420-dependent oxidoreductase